MDARRAINTLEILIAMAIAILTVLASIFLYIDFLSKGEPHFTQIAIDSLFFIIYSARVTFLISTVFLVLIAAISLAYYARSSDPEPSGKGTYSRIPIAQGFLFLFLILSLLSSTTPSIPGFNKLVGIYGLAAYYEETVMVFSIIVSILLTAMLPLFHKNTDKPPLSALLAGAEDKNVYNYFYAFIPAALATGFFYLFYGLSGYDSMFFVLIFLILFIFGKRYGLIPSLLLITITFGSSSIGLILKPVTGIVYPALVLIFAFTGFISSLFFNTRSTSDESSPKEDGSGQGNFGNPATSHETRRKNFKDDRNKLVDSRTLKDQLFIRGVCPHCDSVEFYIKGNGDLECKKCKSIWNGNETEYQSFKVGRNKNYRV